MNRRAAATARRNGTGAPADRPRQRRCLERVGSPAVARAMMHGVEVREQQAEGDTAASLHFRGYASVTETPYDMWDFWGPYIETIASTAFDQTLADGADVAFLLNHGGMTLARTSSGTLTLAADDTGLLTDADLDPQNSVVRDLMSGVRRGDLSEMSFAFRIVRGSWSPDYTAYRIEQVDMDRGDVSVVNYGANSDTFLIGDDQATGEEVDVDALDDDQALALAGRLEQRTARRAAATRSAHATMTRAELDQLADLAAPHPLAGRVHN